MFRRGPPNASPPFMVELEPQQAPRRPEGAGSEPG
jgi:hypothetical protein